MDDPSGNYLFYVKYVRADIKTEQLMYIGSYGMNIIHGDFKFAFEKTSWGRNGIIKGTFVNLYDTPARRAECSLNSFLRPDESKIINTWQNIIIRS